MGREKKNTPTNNKNNKKDLNNVFILRYRIIVKTQQRSITRTVPNIRHKWCAFFFTLNYCYHLMFSLDRWTQATRNKNKAKWTNNISMNTPWQCQYNEWCSTYYALSIIPFAMCIVRSFVRPFVHLFIYISIMLCSLSTHKCTLFWCVRPIYSNVAPAIYNGMTKEWKKKGKCSKMKKNLR